MMQSRDGGRPFDDALDDIGGGEPLPMPKPDVAPESVDAAMARIRERGDGAFMAGEAPERTFPCGKCGGTGIWRSWGGRSSGKCNACQGRGTFKSSEADRRKARGQVRERKERNLAETRRLFDEENPGVGAWLARVPLWRQPVPFLVEMGLKLDQWGYLTEGQLAAVRRSMDREKERDAARRAGGDSRAKPVDITGISKAFAAAAEKGKKHLALFLGDFEFQPAKSSGVNPGAVYVRRVSDKVYLGKIVDGLFLRTRDCDEQEAGRLVAEASSITDFESIVVRGRDTGICCCCGAELTDPVSIAAGIGPICAEKWGGF